MEKIQICDPGWKIWIRKFSVAKPEPECITIPAPDLNPECFTVPAPDLDPDPT
jgi:hypothetical protein